MHLKTSYINFHNVDLCWTVFRVELDDTGNPLEPVITDCSKKFEDTIHVRHAVGMRHSDIFFGTNQLLFYSCNCLYKILLEFQLVGFMCNGL